MNIGVAVYEPVDEGRDFVFTWVNYVIEQLESVKSEDLIGRKVTEVFPGVEEMGLLDVFRRVYRTGAPEHLPLAYYHDDERSGWRDNVVQRLPSGHIATIYRDVSREVNASRCLEVMHQYVLDISQAGSVDEIARHVFEAVRKVLGFTMGSFGVVEGDTIKHIYIEGWEGTFEQPLEGPGIVVRAAKTGKTQLIPDITLDPDYISGLDEEHKMRSELAVPIDANGAVQAVINIESTELDAFSETDRLFMETLARYVSTALTRLYTLRKMEAYSHRLTVLNEASAMLSSAKTVEELVKVVEEIMAELGYSLYDVVVIEGGQARFIASTFSSQRGRVYHLKELGVLRRAIEERETQLVKDAKGDPDYTELDTKVKLHSELAVPVLVNGKVELVLNLESNRVNAFTPYDVTLLELLAQHLSGNLKRLRAEEQGWVYLERLERLSRVMAEMNEAESVDKLAKVTLTLAGEVIKAPYASLGLIEGNALIFSHHWGVPNSLVTLPLDGPGTTVRAVREGRTVLVSDTRLDPDYVKGPLESRSEVAVPLIVDGKPVGVINAESLEPGYFDEYHASLLEALAAHAASNLERIRRAREAEESRIRARIQKIRAEEAERLNKLKTQFISTATHELRTPLASILGYLELIGDTKVALPEDQRRYLEVVERNAQRLKKLTDDLLDQQRIDSGRIVLEKKPLSLAELVDQVVSEMKPIFDSHRQRLVVEKPERDLMVLGDEVRLGQVLVNLLGNASKYSPEGSTVWITVEDHGDEVWFMVHDEGVGIKPEDMPRLFKPFPGIHVPGVKDSTGLGLSICKGIVDLHGGRIWAESMGRGKGATFTFTLPLGGGEN